METALHLGATWGATTMNAYMRRWDSGKAVMAWVAMVREKSMQLAVVVYPI